MVHWIHLLRYRLGQMAPGSLNRSRSSRDLNDGRSHYIWWEMVLESFLKNYVVASLSWMLYFFILLFRRPFWFSCIIGSRSTSSILLKISSFLKSKYIMSTVFCYQSCRAYLHKNRVDLLNRTSSETILTVSYNVIGFEMFYNLVF